MMGVLRTETLLTVDEYLAQERAAENRHQYLDGQVFAMSGESDEHGDISTNFVGILHAHLRGKRCRRRGGNSKIRSGPAAPVSGQRTKGMFSY